MASHSSMNIEKLKLVVLVPLFALAGCSPQVELSQEAPSSADLIFIGDNIITMDDNVASAVAVIGDRISAVGSREEILAMRGETTQFVDLGARALLPGFIDAHGHFGGVATYSALLDLSSPPVGAMENIDDIVAAIRNWIEVNNVPAGDLVYGVGYDDSLLVELRHPNRDDLDRA